MKTAEEVIQELENKIKDEKAKGKHSLWEMNYLIEDGAAEKIEKYFLEHECYYVNVSPCGCAITQYDIIIQWI